MNTPHPPPGTNAYREVFQAFARADSRDQLMLVMRAQAEDYFGCKVTLREAHAQPATGDKPGRWQGSSRWIANGVHYTDR